VHSGISMKMDAYSQYSEFYDLYVGQWLEDLPFYVERARIAKSSLLEIGAGTGRLTLPLAELGFSLRAIDSSPSMLAVLRRRLEQSSSEVQHRVQAIEADIRYLSMDQTFDLILLPYYTFNYLLTPADQKLTLGRLRDLLTVTGELLIDVFVPVGRLRCRASGPVLQVDRACPETGQTFRAWNSYLFDENRQIEERRHRFELTTSDGAIRVAEFITRRHYLFRSQLDRLFCDNGFQIDSVSTGYSGQPAADDSEQLMYVLHRQK
jgi:SAM-dependent methyltransferase